MNERDFLFWLQGFMEIADPKSMDELQIQVIKDHIALVLKKETPNRIKVVADPSLKEGEIRVTTQDPIQDALIKAIQEGRCKRDLGGICRCPRCYPFQSTSLIATC